MPWQGIQHAKPLNEDPNFKMHFPALNSHPRIVGRFHRNVPLELIHDHRALLFRFNYLWIVGPYDHNVKIIMFHQIHT